MSVVHNVQRDGWTSIFPWCILILLSCAQSAKPWHREFGMTYMDMTFLPQQLDSDWGCAFQEVQSLVGVPNIKIGFVEVTKLEDFALQLSKSVIDNSWMTNLDVAIRRAYDRTVKETAEKLVKVFKATSAAGTVGTDFGEVMVSIGSAYALEKIFAHVKLPIAELWKPQLSQNEGFDFHTTCPDQFINFGEAKYSGSGNPYNLAISQAKDFIEAEKHLRDSVHLMHLVEEGSIDKLNKDEFGIVAAFSVNAKNPALILANAVKAAQQLIDDKSIKKFYLVGVR
jgi:hypothetical protein